MTTLRGALNGLLVSLVALSLLTGVVLAQTASILPNAKTQFLNANGQPVSGGSVYTCVYNTTCGPSPPSPKTTWLDPFQATPNADPVVLDSAGSAFIFGSGNYTEALYDAAGNLLWQGFSAGPGLGGIVTSPTYFSSKPFCSPIAYGAVPDGSTNSLAAFNACLAALGNGGGTIWLDYVPGTGGAYCLKGASEGSVFNVSVPIRIIAASSDVNLSSCGSGFSTLIVSAPVIFDGFSISGPGMDGASTFGASEPTIIMAAGSNNSRFYNVFIYGGSPTVQWNCPECQFYNVTAAFSYAGNIAASMYFQTGGGELYNVSTDDNEYPYGIPTPPFTYTAWATSQSVATNAVRTATCQDGKSYVIQAQTGGTTANSGTGPTCKNYLDGLFTDGTVSWQLSHPALLNKWQFDTGASDVHIHQADTGGGNIGMAFTNTLSGTAPQAVSCVTCNGGTSYTAQVYGTAGGSDIQFVGDNFQGPLKTGSYAVDFESTFSGGVSITGGIVGNSPNGIKIAGGSNYKITGVDLSGNAGTALAISGSASLIAAIGNNVHGAATGISVANTASEITFTGNVGCVSGSTTCVTVSSSGANIITSPNDDGVAYALKLGGTTVSNGSAAGCLFFSSTGTSINCNTNLSANGSALAIGGVAYSALPTPAAGNFAYITDGKASNCGDSACTTWGTTVTGGTGALHLFIWYNGTNWTLAGK